MAVDDDQGQAEPLSILSDGPAAGRRNGAIVEATIIDRVTPAMRIDHKELFGPLKPVMRVEGEEAILVANDAEYGLSAAVSAATSSRRSMSPKGIRLPHQRPDHARCGADAVRRAKSSGYGRFGRRAVISEFTDRRRITIEGPQHYPF